MRESVTRACERECESERAPAAGRDVLYDVVKPRGVSGRLGVDPVSYSPPLDRSGRREIRVLFISAAECAAEAQSVPWKGERSPD